MYKVLTQKSKAIKNICRTYHVDKLNAFGSKITDKINKKVMLICWQHLKK
jgi:hypothetical protein